MMAIACSHPFGAALCKPGIGAAVLLLFIAAVANFSLGLTTALRSNSFTVSRLRFTSLEFSDGRPVSIAGLGLLRDGCPVGGVSHSIRSESNATLEVDLGALIDANGWWYLPAAVDSNQPVTLSSFER